MRRVARKRIVLFTIDAERNSEIWTLSEYFPAAARAEREKMPSMEILEALLPNATIETVPAPEPLPRRIHQRSLGQVPELFLEPGVLRASSLWHSLPAAEIERSQKQLRADLESGCWDEKHGHLRTLPELDIGLRIIRPEL